MSKLTVNGRDRGATLPIVALTVPLLILMTSFAVDLGRQRVLRRDLQANADVVALDLVRIIDSDTPPSDTATLTALNASLQQNEARPVTSIHGADGARVQWGNWTEPESGERCPRTIVTEPPTCFAADALPTNAVRVTLDGDIDYFFQPGRGAATRSAIAATTEPSAGFSVGSFAASVNSASSPVLNAAIGDALGLGVLGYTGLATANLDILTVATDLGLGTPEELFTTDVSAFAFLEAAARVLQRDNPDAAQLAVLNQILSVPNSPLQDLSVADVITVAAGGEAAALASKVNVFDFLTTAAFIANGEGGVTIPAVNLGIPGLTKMTGTLHLIQRPQTVFGPVGTSIATSQAGFNSTFELGTVNLGNRVVSTLESVIPGICGLFLLGPILCGLTSRLVQIELTANLNLDLASARGTIDRIACTPAAAELDVGIRADLVSTALTFTAVVTVGGTPSLTVPLTVTAGGGEGNGLGQFVVPPDTFGVFKPVRPGSGSLGLDSTQIQGLGALGSLLTPPLNALLNSTVHLLNSTVILPFSNALGIRVAGADVAPRAITCDTAVKLIG